MIGGDFSSCIVSQPLVGCCCTTRENSFEYLGIEYRCHTYPLYSSTRSLQLAYCRRWSFYLVAFVMAVTSVKYRYARIKRCDVGKMSWDGRLRGNEKRRAAGKRKIVPHPEKTSVEDTQM